MLTSHHYLLSSLFTAFCTFGVASQEAQLQNPHSPPDLADTSVGMLTASAASSSAQQSWLPIIESATQTENYGDSIDVAYRGSGRIDSEPEGNDGEDSAMENSTKRKVSIAHRGSGRALPPIL
ncbi:MAG: hypothetical protein WBA76_22450 [Phormidesmis sp.]